MSEQAIAAEAAPTESGDFFSAIEAAFDLADNPVDEPTSAEEPALIVDDRQSKMLPRIRYPKSRTTPRRNQLSRSMNPSQQKSQTTVVFLVKLDADSSSSRPSSSKATPSSSNSVTNFKNANRLSKSTKPKTNPLMNISRGWNSTSRPSRLPVWNPLKLTR